MFTFVFGASTNFKEKVILLLRFWRNLISATSVKDWMPFLSIQIVFFVSHLTSLFKTEMLTNLFGINSRVNNIVLKLGIPKPWLKKERGKRVVKRDVIKAGFKLSQRIKF